MGIRNEVPPTYGRRKGPRAAPEGRIPPAPIRIKEKSFGGDPKRGPNHLREEKKGFPDLKRYQTLETGFKYIGEMSEWSMVQSWKGCVLKGTGGSNPPLSDKKEREYSYGGFETRSQPPRGGERDRGWPRRGALVRAIPLSPKRK